MPNTASRISIKNDGGRKVLSCNLGDPMFDGSRFLEVFPKGMQKLCLRLTKEELVAFFAGDEIRTDPTKYPWSVRRLR